MGYQRGCRCNKCVKAMRDYDRSARERKVATTSQAAEHKKAEAKARRAANAKAKS